MQSSEDARSMGVRLKDKKNLQQTDRVSKIFKKYPAGHFLGVSRDHCIRQTCTVCPASVSLDSNQDQPGSNAELQRERARLATFADFPTSAPVSAIRLAQAGFYYTGERDVVKCFSCGKTYQCWQRGDRPTLVHARISPNCALVRGSDTLNIPLSTSLPTFAGGGGSDSNLLPPSASAQEQTGSGEFCCKLNIFCRQIRKNNKQLASDQLKMPVIYCSSPISVHEFYPLHACIHKPMQTHTQTHMLTHTLTHTCHRCYWSYHNDKNYIYR